MLGLIAEWCGIGKRQPFKLAEFLAAFDLALLPKEPVVFTAADDAWLKQG